MTGSSGDGGNRCIQVGQHSALKVRAEFKPKTSEWVCVHVLPTIPPFGYVTTYKHI